MATGNITNSLMNSLRSKDKTYEIRDSRAKGFAVKVATSGRMTYLVHFDRGRKITLGSVNVLTPDEAVIPPLLTEIKSRG